MHSQHTRQHHPEYTHQHLQKNKSANKKVLVFAIFFYIAYKFETKKNNHVPPDFRGYGSTLKTQSPGSATLLSLCSARACSEVVPVSDDMMYADPSAKYVNNVNRSMLHTIINLGYQAKKSNRICILGNLANNIGVIH